MPKRNIPQQQQQQQQQNCTMHHLSKAPLHHQLLQRPLLLPLAMTVHQQHHRLQLQSHPHCWKQQQQQAA
jgi:hypothetical protein